MNEELLQLLKDVQRYIEETETIIDGEFGSCRSVQTLVEDGAMPDIYSRVKEYIDNNQG